MPVVGGDGDVVYAVEKGGGVEKKSIESFVVAVLGFKKKKKKKNFFAQKKKKSRRIQPCFLNTKI